MALTMGGTDCPEGDISHTMWCGKNINGKYIELCSFYYVRANKKQVITLDEGINLLTPEQKIPDIFLKKKKEKKFKVHFLELIFWGFHSIYTID